MSADEPRYLRVARALMDVLTPAGIDGFLAGFVVAVGSATIFYLWWIQ